MATKDPRLNHTEKSSAGTVHAAYTRYISAVSMSLTYQLSWSSCVLWADMVCDHVTVQRRCRLCHTTHHESLRRWPLWALGLTAALRDMSYLQGRERERKKLKWKAEGTDGSKLFVNVPKMCYDTESNPVVCLNCFPALHHFTSHSFFEMIIFLIINTCN